MADDKPSRWNRLQKTSLNRKDLTKRMRRAENVTVRHARKFIIKRWSNIRDVRRNIIFWILTVGLLIGATGLQLMWYQKSYITQTAANDGTYAEAVLGPVNTLNPLFASSSAEQSDSRLMFSSLLTYDRTGHLSNDLVTNIAIDTTKTIYTVTIRSDALWQDGMRLTAKDVVFTVGLIKNPSVRSTIAGWSDIKASVVNDTTIIFTVPAVYAAFEHALTFPILPEHVLNNVEPSNLRENSFSSSPIGSGPFKFRFVQNIDTGVGRKVVYMERNANYYNGSPKLEQFQLHVYQSSDEILKALASGEVNAASDLSITNINQVKDNNYTKLIMPVKGGVYAILNTTSPALKDKTVRKALQIGTDTQAIKKKLNPLVPALYLPFISGQLTGDVPPAPTYDIQSARKILDDAGWKLDGRVRKKDGVALKLSIVTIKDSEFEAVLEALAGQWRDIGFDIVTQVADPSDVSQNFVQNFLQRRTYDVLLYQMTIGADPDVYAYWHSSQIGTSGFNFSNYANPISDDALSSARSRLEPGLRNAKYLTFTRQWLDDVPAIGLYQSTAQYAYLKNVTTVRSTDTLISSTDRYANVLYWSVGTKSVYKTP